MRRFVSLVGAQSCRKIIRSHLFDLQRTKSMEHDKDNALHYWNAHTSIPEYNTGFYKPSDPNTPRMDLNIDDKISEVKDLWEKYLSSDNDPLSICDKLIKDFKDSKENSNGNDTGINDLKKIINRYHYCCTNSVNFQIGIGDNTTHNSFVSNSLGIIRFQDLSDNPQAAHLFRMNDSPDINQNDNHY